MRSAWGRAALMLAGFAALVALAAAVDIAALGRGLEHILDRPLAVAGALAAYTGAFLLRAISWRALLDRGAPSVARLLSLLLATLFLNHVAPAKAGDLGRIYALSNLGTDGARAAASVILARLCDLAGLLAVFALTLAALGGGPWSVLAACSAFVAAVCAGTWAFSRLPLPRAKRLEGAPARLVRLLEKLRTALASTNRRSLAAAFAWAAPAWVPEALILYVAARGVGLNLSFAEALAATCLAVLAAAIPLTPGSVGTYEAGAVFLLVSLGFAAGPALAAAVISHALKFLYSFAAAPLALYEGLAATNPRPQPAGAPGKAQDR